jgi:hypothetical protein
LSTILLPNFSVLYYRRRSGVNSHAFRAAVVLTFQPNGSDGSVYLLWLSSLVANATHAEQSSNIVASGLRNAKVLTSSPRARQTLSWTLFLGAGSFGNFWNKAWPPLPPAQPYSRHAVERHRHQQQSAHAKQQRKVLQQSSRNRTYSGSKIVIPEMAD